MTDDTSKKQVLNLDDPALSEDAKALASSIESFTHLPTLTSEHLLDALKSRNSFFDSIKEQFETLHSFPDQWAKLSESLSLGRSLMEKVAEQQEVASSIIDSTSYTSAIDGLTEQMQKFRNAISESVVELPQLTITPFAKQAIEDAESILGSDVEVSPISNMRLIQDLKLIRPANQNDVAVIEEKIDIVTDQLLNLSKALVANREVVIYCEPCHVLMARVQFMLLGQIKCYRCGKLRNIPGKDVRVVMPTATT